MASLATTTSQYQFTPAQANVIGAPVGPQHFGELDVVYSRDNASLKAHYGTSSVDAQSYDAANWQFFNPTLQLGLDCGRVNTAAGRPDLGVSVTGSACYPASINAQAASKSLDPNFNAYGPTAEQVVLAEGDIRYAPSRFQDQNNYAGPSVSGNNYQPRLMGTRDVAPSGCATSMIDQTVGNVSTCSLADYPLPYPNNTDPRTAYNADSPHSQYWAPLDLGGQVSGCAQMGHDYEMASTMCAVDSVTSGAGAPIPPNYSGEQAARAGRVTARMAVPVRGARLAAGRR